MGKDPGKTVKWGREQKESDTKCVLSGEDKKTKSGKMVMETVRSSQRLMR